MVKHFISLEWKSFFRSASFGKSIGIKIFMAFIALYFMAIFLFLGFFMFKILKEVFPNQDPFVVFNGLLFFWVLADLIIRFFFQKLPTMQVKPLLALPVKRKNIVNYVLGKSLTAFINFLPLFAIIPFGITLMLNGYALSNMLVWMLTLVLMVVINNYLNFIIESISAETELAFLPMLIGVAVLFGLNHYQIINISEGLSKGVRAISENPVWLVVPFAMVAALYAFNFKILKNKLFLDSGLKEKVAEISTSNLEWTKNFGAIAPFMQLDLKLIWRNKRSKSSVWIVLMGLLYGLFFYPQPTYQSMPWFFVFIGVFSTGIFLINFGQFIPAWDSSYYKLLMSQNIKYEQYLQSKFTLMALSVAILFILGIPYVFFGWKILLAHFVAAIYNIGVNTHVILYGGSFNRKKIDLSQKAAFNYQGTGAVQWLLGIPLLLIPMGIFALFYFLVGFEVACLVLASLGIAGIVFHQKLMKGITAKYLQSKYKMIDAFNQNN
ncbi:MAG: hypothetical protein KDC97_01105 [Confluentibacter sp.]|nr:hypothetical protein [Confluentibacter sp.]HMR14852.1 DUF5687 family protein [Mariniflexile sp.]